MPSQSKIIIAVNLCLKRILNIDFDLNKTGVCEGLSSLYVKYSLENKTAKFFSLLELLASLPSDYRLGNNAVIDDFIIQIEKTFRPNNYSGEEIQQGELEKILFIGNKPLTNEYNLGLTTDESAWKELLKKITRTNRSYLISSTTHSIAFSFQNGKYNLYDPNYDKKTKKFDSVDALIKEIKTCLGYSGSSFGLSIRIFAHPHAAPEQYPNVNELHHISFAVNVNTESSFYAALANDISTLTYLVQANKMKFETMSAYLLKAFNDLLVEQPKSIDLKNALTRGIGKTLYNGHPKETEKLINHYFKTYSTLEEQNELKSLLQQVLCCPLKNNFALMKKEANYTNLLKIFNQLSLDPTPNYQTHCNHLQLLTFINQAVDRATFHLFLSSLSPEQIMKQIQCAAIINQHSVLNILMSHLTHAKIDPKLFPSIFNTKLIEEINATNLLRLLDMGFVVNTSDLELLSQCMQRKDRTIFEAYARAWTEQTNPELWKHIEKYHYDLINLKTPIGFGSLLEVLVFLSKNEHVKNAWEEDISDEMIKRALTTALWTNNQEMCLFLQKQLEAKNSSLDQDTLEFFYKKALEDEDLSVLSLLTLLHFNIVRNTKDIPALFNLCNDFQDYSIIETCFERATPKIKQIIFANSVTNNVTSVIKICMQRVPHLFYASLQKTSDQPGRLAKLNRAVSLQIPNIFTWEIDSTAQKKLIKNCFKNNLSELVNLLFQKVTWEEAELNEFLNELIQEKNGQGIILLFKAHPTLKEKQELPSVLTQANLLHALECLITRERVIEKVLTEHIFTTAIANNHSNLIRKFLEQRRITPQTPLKQPLVTLLKQAIERGNDSVLDPFIQSNQDFGLNFKELFLFSCVKKQGTLANQLLAKEFALSDSERESAIEQLFGKQPISVLFETVYVQTYGRLYQLLLKSKIQNPRTALLNSIKNPEQDTEFKQTELYLNPLKRAIKEKNKKIFNALFTQSNLPCIPDSEVLSFLKDPGLFAYVFPLFEKKYGLKELVTEALKQNEWAVLAHLIEKKKLSDLDIELQQPIQEHGKKIVGAYKDNLDAYYDKIDVRPQLFTLLDTSNDSALAQLANPYRAVIQANIERIELNMLKKHLDLNNQIYRYSFSNKSFKTALEEIAKVFVECKNTLIAQNIDLNESIKNSEIINNLAQIKLIMAGHDIVPDYLPEESADLLQKLLHNSRFKSVCELELKIYYLLKQMQKPLSYQEQTIQEEFNKVIKSLHECLEQTQLPTGFVLPTIQSHLESYRSKLKEPVDNCLNLLVAPKPNLLHTSTQGQTQLGLERLKLRCNKALKYYLQHRNTNLSVFSYYFDYYRGQTRANHYKNLTNSATTVQELYVLVYALFINGNGTQLKKDMTLQLNYENEMSAKYKIKSVIKQSHSEEELAQLDQVIASINKKINVNDTTETEILFRCELDFFSHLRRPKSPLANNSLFQPKKPDQKTGFWNWIANRFGFNAPSSEEDSLSLKK